MAGERHADVRADGKPAASASAAARAAGAAVKSEDFQKAFTDHAKSVMGKDDDGDESPAVPAPEEETDEQTAPEPEDDPADDRDEGTSPEPTPTGDDEDDEDESSDDYDEEAVDAPAEEDEDASGRPKTKVAAPAAEKDWWNQYSDDEARKKAFSDNKRYGIEMADKAKRLEEENAALKTGKAPAATDAPTTPQPPAPQAESLEELGTRLFKEHADVKRVVTELGEKRKTIIARTEKLEGIRTELSAAEQARTKLSHRIEYLEEQKKKDPENYAIDTEIDGFRAQILRLDTQIDAKATAIGRVEFEIERLQDAYNGGVHNFDNFLKGEQARIAEEAQVRDRNANDTKAFEDEWTGAIPKLFDEHKIGVGPDKAANLKLRKRLERRLLERADADITYKGQIPNLTEYLRAAVADIAEEHSIIRGGTAQAYTTVKKRHAAAPGPKGPAAVAKSQAPTGRVSARDADRAAAAAMKTAFGGR